MYYTKSDLLNYPYFNECDNEVGIDYLTGVLDRRTITGLIQHQIENNISFAISICDFDNFKRVNDVYGHFYGDIALQEVSKALYEVTKGWGLVGRFGGDEFLIYIHNVEDYDELWSKNKDLNNCVKSIEFKDVLQGLIVTQTIGCARFPFNAKTYEDLFKKADKALYRGKQKGRNCFIIYKEEIHKDIDTSNSSSIIALRSTFDRACKVLDMEISINEKIKHIFSTLSKEYGIDHICINFNNKIENQFKRNENLKMDYIDEKEYSSLISDNMFYTNNYSTIKPINPNLHRICYDYQIKALFVYELRFNGEYFGIVRIEDCSVKRVWQDYEISCYIAMMNIVAMLKYFEKYEKMMAL